MPKAILIVDDDAYVRQLICEAFKRESDFEVCGEAANGKEAIDKALALHPDLIVLDLSMPVMNGLAAARELKDRMPSVPIILFTLYVDSFFEEEAVQPGVSDLVPNPKHILAFFAKARVLLYGKPAEI